MKILSLFIRHGDVNYGGAYQALMALYATLPGIQIDSVLIDTDLPAGFEAHLGLQSLLMAGDNSRREFSGWDSALARFRGDLSKYDLVHLITSAFQNEYNGFYPLVSREMLDYIYQTPNVMMAHLDAYPERVRLFGRGFQTWGCSKFLFARPSDLLALGSIVGPFDKTNFFDTEGKTPFRDDAPLSKNYANYLTDWLTGKGLPHGKWHSVFRYQDETVAKFQSKALSIIDEHSFSMRIRESGIRIVDFTYWHANSKEISKVFPPEELIQVRERNNYLFGAPLVEGEVARQNPYFTMSKKMTTLVDGFETTFTGELVDVLMAGVGPLPEVNSINPKLIKAAMLNSVGYRYTQHEHIWLGQESEDLEQDAPLPITRGLHAEWLARPDLRQVLDLDTKVGRQELVAWWYVSYADNYLLSTLIDLEILNEPWMLSTKYKNHFVTIRHYLLWYSREDLRSSFDIFTFEGYQQYLAWLTIYGTHEVLSNKLCNCASITEFIDYKNQTTGYAQGGVNIIGYGRGEFGIGEDVRMAVKAFSEVNVEIAVPRLPLRIAARQNDCTIAAYEVSRPVYQTNLICLPPYEMIRLLASTGDSIIGNRYNISFWQWELARFPNPLTYALDFVNEIWSASMFTAEVMRSITDKPVIHMPVAVNLPQSTSKWTRKHFSLPESDFIYLTVLDGNSSLKRKNPLATVRAFLSAFPDKNDVCLVIKAMNVSVSQPDWFSVVKYAEEDKRIILMAEMMTKDKLLGLQSICDCFVSLHRSEGFGRNIAEAMLLGKPVIVSDYSGNKDFTNEETAFLVGGSLVPLSAGDYAFFHDQVWFEPQADVASSMFRFCYEFPEVRRRKALAGQAWIRENYSSERVGEAYKSRLDDLHRK